MINDSFVCDFKAYTSRSFNKVRLLATCFLKALKWYFNKQHEKTMEKSLGKVYQVGSTT